LATVGLIRIPFGFEAQEPSRRRPFLERSNVVNALFSSTPFDLGLRLSGAWRFLRYGVALMNGSPLGNRTFPGRDPNESKDLLFRVGVDTAVNARVRVEAGISSLSGRGFHQGLPPTKDVLVWRDTNEDSIVTPTEIQAIAGRVGTKSESFKRFALGADLRVFVTVPVLGPLVLRGEIIRGVNLDRAMLIADPVAQGRDLREIGGYVGFCQDITPWAQVGMRYDVYHPDADQAEQAGIKRVPRNPHASTYSVMAALRYVDPGDQQRNWGRLVLQYDHNGNTLGRDPSGAPTTLADDTFTARAEVSF
jgi:hypothetical protein